MRMMGEYFNPRRKKHKEHNQVQWVFNSDPRNNSIGSMLEGSKVCENRAYAYLVTAPPLPRLSYHLLF
jgi:hypothetical protein